MKTPWAAALVLALGSALPLSGHASLFGPWHRYRSENLGFQVPYVDDWQITELKNCVVFAMQLNPDPYVRLAVGRIHASRESLEQSVDTQLAQNHETKLSREVCRFAGHPAIRVEGDTAAGHVLDFYVDTGAYRYWISVLADKPGRWGQYEPSIAMILSGFRFI